MQSLPTDCVDIVFDFLSLSEIIRKVAKLSKRERKCLQTKKTLFVNVKKILFMLKEGDCVIDNFEWSFAFLISKTKGVTFDFQSLISNRFSSN